MFTQEGNQLTAQVLLERVQGALVVVGDGSNTVVAAQDDGFPKLGEDGASILFQATFGPDEANFEWRGEGIKLNDDVIEWEDRDAGRKALGATWTTQITIEIGDGNRS